MTKKLITQKEAKASGVVISKAQKLDKIKFYRLNNGNIIDSNGDTRFINNK